MVTMTEKASTRMKEVLAEKELGEDTPLRLFIREGGCSGFSYGMAFDKGPRENDQIIEQHGIRIVIDPFSAMHLRGVEVDYVDGMMGGGFTVRNPNAVQTCGCGQSFRTAEATGKAEPCDG